MLTTDVRVDTVTGPSWQQHAVCDCRSPAGAGPFVTTRDGLIADMTEVWTDIDQTALAGKRPQ